MQLDADDAFKQLTAFCDRAIVFFKRRADLEQQYVDGLEKLIAKQDEIDKRQPASSASLFARWDSGIQIAWLQMRAITYAELSDRRILVDALKRSVIDPLTAFRDQKDRQRRRIAEEARNVVAEHKEYKTHTLKLQRVYARKSDDAAQLGKEHAQAFSVGSPPHLTGGNTKASTSSHSGSSQNHHGISRSAATSPIPANLHNNASPSHLAYTNHLQYPLQQPSGPELHTLGMPESYGSSGYTYTGMPVPPSQSDGMSAIATAGAASISVYKDSPLPSVGRVDKDKDSGPPNLSAAIKSSRQQLNSLIAKLGKARNTNTNTYTSPISTSGQHPQNSPGFIGDRSRSSSVVGGQQRDASGGSTSSWTGPSFPQQGPNDSQSQSVNAVDYALAPPSTTRSENPSRDRDVREKDKDRQHRQSAHMSSTAAAISQQRLSKAKREAEEADAAYRAAIHHLETLRLQRERVSKAGFGSLTECAYELGDVCRSAFVQYSDSVISRARHSIVCSDKARQAAIAVDSAEDCKKYLDAAGVTVYNGESLPYLNYHVGVSYSLIFGVSLSEYTAANDGTLVPLTVQRAILEIDSRGLEVEGIYRIPGKLGLIQQVIQEIEQDEIMFEFDPDRHDIHTVAGVLKLYLRQLPEPLLPLDASAREAITMASEEEALRMLIKRLRRLSASHQATAKMLMAHLDRVLAHSEQNKMSAQALALCLNPVFFPEDSAATIAAAIAAGSSASKDKCLEFLISHRKEIFEGLPVLDEPNNPYRNPRMSSSSAEVAGDDGDPAWRNSVDTARLTASPQSNAAVQSSRQTQLGSLGAPSSAYSGDHGNTAQQVHLPNPNLLSPRHLLPAFAGTPPHYYTPSDSSYASQPLSREGSALTHTTGEVGGVDPALLHHITSMSSGESHIGSLSPSGSGSPRRSFSQRARSGSLSLANAVKSSLGRSKSPGPGQLVLPGQGASIFQPQQHAAYLASAPLSPLPLAVMNPSASCAGSPLREAASFEWVEQTPTPATGVPPDRLPFNAHQAPPLVPAPPPLPAQAPLPKTDSQLRQDSGNSEPSSYNVHPLADPHRPPSVSYSPDMLPAGAAPLVSRPPSSFAPQSPYHSNRSTTSLNRPSSSGTSPSQARHPIEPDA